MNSSRDPQVKGVIFNLYPDSLENDLNYLSTLFSRKEFKNAFSLIYLLPTFFHSDLDRGFSIIDYDINEELVSYDVLEAWKKSGIELKLDIVLNHLSVASPQFNDVLEKGGKSEFKDFFINWNDYWAGHGVLDENGIMIPRKEYLERLFMRKPGLPVLQVEFPDGSVHPYWNTFYQEIKTIHKGESGEKRILLGQMDVNAKSDAVWKFYEETLYKLKSYGCKIVRLDAFAYLHKEVGKSNFFNVPGTWDYLERIQKIANQKNLIILPEIHAEYGAGLHKELSDRGYLFYDFFLPGLILHTLESRDSSALLRWGKEIIRNKYRTVNMLGCHDGIPVLDLKGKEVGGVYRKGLLEDEQIDQLIRTIVDRGGKIKNLFDSSGNKISYYQVNATFYSALGEDPKKMMLSRALQLFFPGTPQIWYLDLFAGKNDLEAVEKMGVGGHKEINRTNLSQEHVESSMDLEIVQKQLEMIRLRNSSKAFEGNVRFEESSPHQIKIHWTDALESALLSVDLQTLDFEIQHNHI